MRINKYLALCQIASRRKCDELIKNGEITVNGKVCTTLGVNINEKKDKVLYKGKEIKPCKEFIYIKLHKPKGYICSSRDDRGRKTVFDLLDIPEGKRLFSVGRLDYDTEGLLILTNDGDFANLIIHPSSSIEKKYIVKIEGSILESELAVLRAGVVIDGVRFPKCKVELLEFSNNTSRLEVTINEGLNRQIRRMFEAISKNIVLLKRIQIGSVKLGGLKRGTYRDLTERELLSFREN